MAGEEIGLLDLHVDDNPTNSSTVESHELWAMHPMPWHWWQVLQLILAVWGILGNLVVIVVLLRPGRVRTSTDALIAALGVADFVTSLAFIPHQQAIRVPDTTAGRIYCQIVHPSYFVWLSTYASTLTLVTISLERYLAVVRPHAFQRIFASSRSMWLIVSFIWVVSFILNSYHFYIVPLIDGECVVMFPSPGFQKFLGLTIFTCRYLLPVVVLVFAHSSMVVELRNRRAARHLQRLTMRTQWCRRNEKQERPPLRRTKSSHKQRRIVAVLFVIITVFVVCWTPDQLFFLFFNLGIIPHSYAFSDLYRVLVLLAIGHTFANSIIYAAINPKFRAALREMFTDVWDYFEVAFKK